MEFQAPTMYEIEAALIRARYARSQYVNTSIKRFFRSVADWFFDFIALPTVARPL